MPAGAAAAGCLTASLMRLPGPPAGMAGGGRGGPFAAAADCAGPPLATADAAQPNKAHQRRPSIHIYIGIAA
jgi:hypothetical protein